MATRLYNPSTIVAPASNYSQCAMVDAGAKRLIISGQLGIDSGGNIQVGVEAQMRQIWANIFAALDDAGMGVQHLVKVSAFITDESSVGLYRTVRDELFDGHAPASTLLVVKALATPDFLVEIEAEAVG